MSYFVPNLVVKLELTGFTEGLCVVILLFCGMNSGVGKTYRTLT